MKVFILILNFNGRENTLECVRLLLKDRVNAEIIIIDNASTDGSIASIKKQFPQLKIIENNKNLGFAAGNNVGIRYALKNKAQEIVLLNNDAFLSSSSLKYLSESSGNIVGPVLEFRRNGETVYDLGGHINWWLGRTTHEEVKSKKEIGPRKPDYVSGATMLVRRNVFEEIGLLDERYFLYYEDADFCTRAKKAGIEVNLEHKAIVQHELGASLGRHSLSTSYQNLRSNLSFIIKNLSWYRKPVGIAYWLLLVTKVILNRVNS